MKEWIVEECPALTLDGRILGTMLRREQELIRCKDCKHCDDIDMYGYVQCDKAETHDPDWYCADGERGDSE